MTILDIFFILLLAVAAVVDWRSLIIPDSITIGGTVVLCIYAYLYPSEFPAIPAGGGAVSPTMAVAEVLLWGVVGFCLGLALYWLGRIFFKKQIAAAQQIDAEVDSAFGLGDAKLMGLLCAYLGGITFFYSLLIAAISASLWGVVHKLRSGQSADGRGLTAFAERWRTGNSLLPFGPFLALGGICGLVMQRLEWL